MNIRYTFLSYILCFFFVALTNSCDLEMELPEATPGTGNFARYIAVGSSFTAGYTGDGLNLDAQLNSYPNLLAQQFALVGGTDINQPYLPEGNGSGMYRLLGVTTDTCNNITPNLQKTSPDPNWENNVSSNGPFHNLGIPNLKVGDLNNGIMSILNGYLKRVVPSGTTYMELLEVTVNEIQPTYFTNWLGMTDAVGFAATGGGYTDNTPVSLFSLTDTLTFAANYEQALDLLTANNAQGMVFTIPKIFDFPFFTSVAYQAQGPDSCSHRLDIYITASNGIRKATYNANSLYNDLILLPAGAVLGRLDVKNIDGVDSLVPYGLSAANPLLHHHVLDRNEVQSCVLAINAYNRAIRKAATTHNIPVIDTNEYFTTLKKGTAYNGIPLNMTFISGGFFGLDGIHPHDRGYALLSNFFIQKIDSIHQATIPEMDISRFSGVVFQ